MKKENILSWFGVYSMRVYYLGNRDSNSSLKRNIYKPPDISLKFDRNEMMSLWREKLALLFFLFKVTLSSYDYYHFLSSYLFALSQTHLILKYGYCDFRSDQTNHHWQPNFTITPFQGLSGSIVASSASDTRCTFSNDFAFFVLKEKKLWWK